MSGILTPHFDRQAEKQKEQPDEFGVVGFVSGEKIRWQAPVDPESKRQDAR